jgi:hypothetical protein
LAGFVKLFLTSFDSAIQTLSSGSGVTFLAVQRKHDGEIGSSSLSVSLARNPQGFDGGSEEKRSGSGPLHHSTYQKQL